MKQSVVLAIGGVLAAVALVVIAVARSNTAPGPVEEQPASEVAVEPDAGDGEKADSRETQPRHAGKGIAAIEQAAETKKYLFAFFWKEEEDQTFAMREVFRDAMGKMADRADSVEINVTDASERAIVDKFGLDRAPMPLILALAPNGAITGGFPTKVGEQQLLEAFASPCTEKCMKALQDRKLVFLCVQNTSTKSNGDAMQGVRDFKADGRFARATEIVMLDPTDTAEAEFLNDLRIDPKTTEAATVFLVPPGMPLAMYEGATSKDELVATLQKAGTGCGPGGCGPGGCGPKKE